MPTYAQWQSKPTPGTGIDDGHPLTQGMFDTWPANEGGGLSLYSAGPRRLTGALNSSVTWTSTRFGTALSFASGGVITTAGNTYNWERTQPFSCSLWAAPNAAAFGYFLTTEDVAATIKGWGIALTGTNQIRFNLRADSTAGNEAAIITTPTLPTGVASHVVVTYDGSSTAAGLKAYINGVLAAVTVPVDALSASIVTAIPLRIGLRNGGGGPFVGTMGDIVTWNRALSPADVAGLYGNPWAYYASPWQAIYFFSATGATYMPWLFRPEEGY